MRIAQAFGLRELKAPELEDYMWRACAMAGGLYAFYLLEGLANYLIRLKQVRCASESRCTPPNRASSLLVFVALSALLSTCPSAS